MKIALVHDYLTQRGGAERVFELFCKYFPEADIYTSLYDAGQTIDLQNRRVNTTILQKIPGAARYFRLLAPLYYPAFRTLNLQDYDLIVSSSSSFAKSVRKRPGAKHICFCHNVTRFLWDTESYLKNYSDYKLFYPFLEQALHSLIALDRKYAQEPDLYIANSQLVARRIEKAYGRKALAIHYPINNQKFQFDDRKENFYLVASRLLGYKRIDVTIQAFNALGWPLIVIGDGPERPHLEGMASDNIKFMGYVSDEERSTLMAKAKGVVIAALEDYGLVPIEANASGTPTIAYGAGGILETQIPGVTGLFFQEQTPESLKAALLIAEEMVWDWNQIRHHAIARFSEEVFLGQIRPLFQQTCDLAEPQLRCAPRSGSLRDRPFPNLSASQPCLPCDRHDPEPLQK